MLRIRDITGQVFGRLTVKKLHPDRTKHCKAQWICECTCGKMTVVQGSSLRNGSTKSCGCLRIEYQQAQTDAGKSRNCLNNRNKRKSVCYMKRWMVLRQTKDGNFICVKQGKEIAMRRIYDKEMKAAPRERFYFCAVIAENHLETIED